MSALAVCHLHDLPLARDETLIHLTEFAGGKVDPHEAGKKGGEAGGASSGGNSGSSGNGQFAGGKVDPVEAGRKGGNS